MQKFVFWTGIYDIVMASTIACPWVVKMLGVPLPESYFWLWFAAALVIDLGILLVLLFKEPEVESARDLLGRHTEIGRVPPDGRFRLFGPGLGPAVVLLGLVDLIIGLVYLVGLPRGVNTTAMNILLDK